MSYVIFIFLTLIMLVSVEEKDIPFSIVLSSVSWHEPSFNM